MEKMLRVWLTTELACMERSSDAMNPSFLESVVTRAEAGNVYVRGSCGRYDDDAREVEENLIRAEGACWAGKCWLESHKPSDCHLPFMLQIARLFGRVCVRKMSQPYRAARRAGATTPRSQFLEMVQHIKHLSWQLWK